MTTAEANNERATVEEFARTVACDCMDAQNAGLPAETIARQLLMLGISGAIAAGVPLDGLHNIEDYLAHVLAETKRTLMKTGNCLVGDIG